MKLSILALLGTFLAPAICLAGSAPLFFAVPGEGSAQNLKLRVILPVPQVQAGPLVLDRTFKSAQVRLEDMVEPKYFVRAVDFVRAGNDLVLRPIVKVPPLHKNYVPES